MVEVIEKAVKEEILKRKVAGLTHLSRKSTVSTKEL